MKRVVALIFASVLLSNSNADELKSFTSDGCSEFPNGTLSQKELWLECCTAHDLAYWKGGTRRQRIDADNELHDCVSKVGEAEIAFIMLTGVRVGGTPLFPTEYRWGYGWSYPRFYRELTAAENKQVEEALSAVN
jgi:hypothetical protein